MPGGCDHERKGGLGRRHRVAAALTPPTPYPSSPRGARPILSRLRDEQQLGDCLVGPDGFATETCRRGVVRRRGTRVNPSPISVKTPGRGVDDTPATTTLGHGRPAVATMNSSPQNTNSIGGQRRTTGIDNSDEEEWSGVVECVIN